MSQRSEFSVLQDLEALCTSPGYIHALCFLVFRDSYIRYSDQMSAEDFLETYSTDKLIRSEFATILGLIIRKPLNLSMPEPSELQQMIERTDALLEQLHQSFMPSLTSVFEQCRGGEDKSAILGSGAVLREAVFYSGESAYNFQYRDLSKLKYADDDPWLIANRGFSIAQAVDVATEIATLQVEKLAELRNTFSLMPPNEWTLLPAFTFTTDELSSRGQLTLPVIQRVLDAFSVPDGERNTAFKALNDYNVMSAYPILRLPDEAFTLLQPYSLLESVYESPFYWMLKDDKYREVAQMNRGAFTEAFATQRLVSVFGSRVKRNVTITDSRNQTLGEIDTLVVFGDRAIVLQAKSKRMTLEARRGNDGVIKSDFAKSVQNSYDQAHSCSKLMQQEQLTFEDGEGNLLRMPTLKAIYLMCVLSDHYPALSFQSSHFISLYDVDSVTSAPFVLDIFTLDVMAEMLSTPLHFLSYVDRRTTYADKVAAGHELTVLAYHLRANLWMNGQFDRVMLTEDISASLDLAMTVRRDGIKGPDTPKGILTHSKGTIYGAIVSSIETKAKSEFMDLGMMLLKMSGNSIDQLNQGAARVLSQVRDDGAPHDVVMGSGDTGIAIHSSRLPRMEAKRRLQNHVDLRKYKGRASEWYGIFLDPETGMLQFGYNAIYPWSENPALEKESRFLVNEMGSQFVNGRLVKRKVGRNETCPCGSGKKYKKCHGI